LENKLITNSRTDLNFIVFQQQSCFNEFVLPEGYRFSTCFYGQASHKNSEWLNAEICCASCYLSHMHSVMLLTDTS